MNSVLIYKCPNCSTGRINDSPTREDRARLQALELHLPPCLPLPCTHLQLSLSHVLYACPSVFWGLCCLLCAHLWLPHIILSNSIAPGFAYRKHPSIPWCSRRPDRKGLGILRWVRLWESWDLVCFSTNILYGCQFQSSCLLTHLEKQKRMAQVLEALHPCVGDPAEASGS